MDDPNRPPQSFAQYPHPSFVYGHPCSLPPHQHRLNPAYYDDQAGKKSFTKDAVLWCWAVLFLVFFVYCMVGGLMATTYNAKMEIDSAFALVSPFNFSTSQLYQNWDIRIFLRNPNRIASITYRNFSASLNYKKSYIWSTGSIPSTIHLGPKKEAFQNVSINVFSRDVANSTAGSIDSEIARGSVDFSLKLKARIRYAGTMFSLSHSGCVEATCDGVEIGFPANATTGAMLGGRKICDKQNLPLSDCDES